MILRRSALAAALAAASAGVPLGQAFTSSAPSSRPRALLARPSTRASPSSLNMGPPADPSAPLTEQYGEGSRKYRRTVYTHDAWVKHRSSDRFVNNLGTLFQSGIYKQVGKEVSATVSVAAFVCLWNALVGGYQDLDGVMHDPVINAAWATKIGIPMEAFTILSPSLGLLLVFRTNSSYNRWDEARKFWGLNINHTRDLNRMATAWYGKQTDFDGTEFFEDETKKLAPIDPAERRYLLGQVSLMTWAFVRSMKRHLSPPKEDEEDYVAEVRSRMTPEQAEALIGATHRPNRALYDLSTAIEQLPMHFVRKNAINNNLSIFEDTLGGSERLLSSPVPLFYSRHTARFLATWLLLLPLGLYGQFSNSWNHVAMIPATLFISVALFGIEELATQLEEPFTILPMQGFCDKIGANCFEIVGWAGQGQEGEEELEAQVEALPAAEQFVPFQSAKKDDVAPATAEDEASALEVLANELLFPLFDPTIVKDVDGSAVRGAAINGIFLTLLASVLKSGPLSVTEPGTLIEAASIGTAFAYVSITEGRAGDFARGVGSTTMDIVGELFDEKDESKAETKSAAEVESPSPKPPIEAPSSEIIAESMPSIEEEATAEDVELKVDLEAPATQMFFAEKETKPEVQETKPEEAKPVIDAEKIISQKEDAASIKEETKVPEARPEKVTSRPAVIENRARRRISLRERLEQMEEVKNAVKAPQAEKPLVEAAPAKVESVEAAAVEDIRPEEEMAKMMKSKPDIKAENRAKASLSLREIVSGMN